MPTNTTMFMPILPKDSDCLTSSESGCMATLENVLRSFKPTTAHRSQALNGQPQLAVRVWAVVRGQIRPVLSSSRKTTFSWEIACRDQPGELPPGAAGPTWNGGFIEAHYTYNPQRHLDRLRDGADARQANPATQKIWRYEGFDRRLSLSDHEQPSGPRWHQEYAIAHTTDECR